MDNLTVALPEHELHSYPATMRVHTVTASAATNRSQEQSRPGHGGRHHQRPEDKSANTGGWSLLTGLLPLAKKSKKSELSPTSSLSSTSLASVDGNDYVVVTCKCCGNVIKYPANIQKYRCVFCKTNFATSNYDYNTPSHGLRTISRRVAPVTFNTVKEIADVCFGLFQKHISQDPKAGAGALTHFKLLEDYLYKSFNNADCLNCSFALSKNYKLTHSQPNVNFHEVRETFKLLLSLPVKKPFFTLLTAANALLHDPPVAESPQDLNWLLILLEVPTLPYALHFTRVPSSSRPIQQNGARIPPNILFFESKEVKAVSYKIVERTVGLLSNCEENCANYLINWFARYPEAEFKRKVELINLYITFHLRLIINRNQGIEGAVLSSPQPSQPSLPINRALGSSQRRSLSDCLSNRNHININVSHSHFNAPSEHPHSANNSSSSSPEIPFDKEGVPEQPQSAASTSSSLSQQFLQLSSRIPIWANSSKKRSKKADKIKVKVSEYGNDWHLKVAAKLLSFFYQASISGKSKAKCHDSFFYNSLVDFINVKQDFDAWQSLSGRKSTTKTQLTVEDMVLSVNDYLQSAVSASLSPVATTNKPTFAFCQFPFLLSIASKITIIEYEAKRQMEKKAEEAFLHAINKKTIVEVYFKVRVRREHITNDSLRCIKESPRDLKKSLKIEFIGEPGIDAGGLKKEWFLILTKRLFDPNNGLFLNVPESNYLWFTLNPDSTESLELYYLVGVVLGLAIYNSTILDLKFPPALYKMLLNKPVTFEDYLAIFPETGSNLKKLATYDGKDFDTVFDGILFELDYKDLFDQVKTVELIPNGSKTSVNSKNKGLYLKKYSQFYLSDGIKDKFRSFKNGFENVINGNAFSLFSAEEIERILCGSDEGNRKFDLETLKSIARYNGFMDNTSVAKVPAVKWFWQYFESLSISDQKKLMLFVTGSDRVPATGIVSMNFKITRLGGDSNRLPVAHTCFNEICIYEYKTRDKFINKLTTAINESEGFGIK